VTTWLNTPIQMQFRVIDGLTARGLRRRRCAQRVNL